MFEAITDRVYAAAHAACQDDATAAEAARRVLVADRDRRRAAQIAETHDTVLT